MHLWWILAVVGIQCTSGMRYSNDDINDYITYMDILHKPRSPQNKLLNNGTNGSSFQWKNCGQLSDLVTVKNIELGPDTIKIPGTVIVTGSGKINSPLQAPIALSLKVKKKVFAWIDVPCIDDMGSCDYDDACALISQFPCPPEFPQCHCPFAAGPVNVTKAAIEIDVPGIPKWMTEGEYQIDARATYKGQEVFCLQFQLTMG